MANGDPILLGTAGSNGNWHLQAGSGPRRRDDGLDSLIRRYIVGAKPEQLSLPSRYSTDREGTYSQMYLIDDDVRLLDGKSSEVELTYAGTRDGSLPTASVEQGFTVQTASQTDGELQLEVLYRSPHTTWHWIGTSDRMTYAGFTGAANPTIISRRIDGHVLPAGVLFQRLVLQTALSRAQAAKNSALVSSIQALIAQLDQQVAALKAYVVNYFNRVFSVFDTVTDFRAVPLVPGKFWQCQSTTSRTLVGF